MSCTFYFLHENRVSGGGGTPANHEACKRTNAKLYLLLDSLEALYALMKAKKAISAVWALIIIGMWNTAAHAGDARASQAEAIARYPELAKPNSPFHAAFMVEYKRLKSINDPVLGYHDWPMQVARWIASEFTRVERERKMADAKALVAAGKFDQAQAIIDRLPAGQRAKAAQALIPYPNIPLAPQKPESAFMPPLAIMPPNLTAAQKRAWIKAHTPKPRTLADEVDDLKWEIEDAKNKAEDAAQETRDAIDELKSKLDEQE